MPNPMFLKLMGVTLQEYNTYSHAKKERFQTAAAKRLADLHESDIDGYVNLTKQTEVMVAEKEAKSEWEIQQDKENE
jgi:hypothetical protein